jgi:hypothetical protein
MAMHRHPKRQNPKKSHNEPLKGHDFTEKKRPLVCSLLVFLIPALRLISGEGGGRKTVLLTVCMVGDLALASAQILRRTGFLYSFCTRGDTKKERL